MLFKRFTPLLVLLLTTVAINPLTASAACQEKLAEIDARISEAELGPTAAGITQMRDHAASLCDQGQESTAMQLLGLLEMSLPPSEALSSATREANADSKAALTDEFLEGTWCSMTGEERSQLVFNRDGTYRYCLHDSMLGPYGKCSRNPEPTEDWLARFERAETVDRDTLVLGGRNTSTFKRGECSRYGR